MGLMRLNRYLAIAGVGSRRGVNEVIKAGRVKINGKSAQLNHKVDPAKDLVEVDGRELSGSVHYEYFLLNKPTGVISTTADELGRKSVVDLVKSDTRLYPVGRLDADTSGLLILTNDGELTYQLTHPKFHVSKKYRLVVSGSFGNREMSALRDGINLKEGKTSPAQAEVIKQEGNRTSLFLTIHQGWNHQIRRMVGVLGLNLLSLQRVAIGNLQIEDLGVGKFRSLSREEVEGLKKEAN